MRTTVTLRASDLLGLKPTSCPPSALDGRQQLDNGSLGEPYLYVTPEEARDIANFFSDLADELAALKENRE